MDNPFQGPVYAAFSGAAGRGAEYELHVRLLADKTPKLQEYALALNLGNIEKPLVEHFANALSEREKTLLATVRVLRNKLLHGEFTTARTKLETLGYPKQQAKIQVIKLPDKLTADVIPRLVETAEPFAVDAAPDAGNLFAWFLQLAFDGSFKADESVFQNAINIIDRLALL